MESQSGQMEKISLIERIVFANRPLLLMFFTLVTVFFCYHMLKLQPVASFERMIPIYHDYIRNAFKHADQLKNLSNSIRIVIETSEGDIFTKEYMETLKDIHDTVFFINGVDRQALESLWASRVRWTEVTEEGFTGGTVMPDRFSGTPEQLDLLKKNIFRSGRIGSLIANDFKSTALDVPLYDHDPKTGKALDYRMFSQDIEKNVREKFQNDKIKIHIIGFAQLVGDLIEGMTRVGFFFLIAFIILLLLLWINSRCWRSTLMRAVSSIIAVIWQMGILSLLGYGLNPYSMLVPFLMFALGVSHGIQMFNAIVHEMMGGLDRLTAVRRAYRCVYAPGLSALFTDGVGFALLFIIAIGVIQDIAIGATVGVAVVAFCDLCLLPVLMSYSGISGKALIKMRRVEEEESHFIWSHVASVTKKKQAATVLFIAAILFAGAFYASRDLKIGDLDPGAPELRSDSRYNLDNAYIIAHYASSSDLLVVMAETPKGKCSTFENAVKMDLLQWRLLNTPGVQSVQSLTEFDKKFLAGMNEGNLKWYSITRSQRFLDLTSVRAIREAPPLVDADCTFVPIRVYLTDHKAETLAQVVHAVEEYKSGNDGEEIRFLLAAGSAGIEAATNVEVEKANTLITWIVYLVVIVVCLLTFHSLSAPVCIVLPLYITSVLCEAVMAKMGIGIKVATLPVIAVGVGIGIDYGIYIYSKLKYFLDKGYELTDAYFQTLKTTGRAVAFTGMTLGVGVGTWVFSPIKFQADMGMLLTFMFVWNMVGALLVLPALGYFLLSKNRTKKAS